MTLPELPGPEREAVILEAVRAGRHDPIEWRPIRASARGHDGTIEVMADALKLDGVRVNVTATTAQQIADVLGASMPTARLVDLAYEQAEVRCRPCIQPPSATMAYTGAMKAHSQAIDQQVAGRRGLVRTVGKDFILHDRLFGFPDKACNYGWPDAKAPFVAWSGQHVYQPIATAHNRHHTDYSQTLCLVRSTMLVDGDTRALADVMRDSELSWLVSNEGVMRVTRMPGVPAPGGAPASKEIPKALTPLDKPSFAAVLRDAHHFVFGEFPSMARLGVAWAQCMHEHRRGEVVYCHNIGNVTAFGGWPGDYYAWRLAGENPADRSEVRVMKFRAHADFIDGARGYWRVLSARYAKALASFDAGEPIKACAALHAAGYFTADLAPYAASVAKFFIEFNAHIAPVL